MFFTQSYLLGSTLKKDLIEESVVKTLLRKLANESEQHLTKLLSPSELSSFCDPLSAHREQLALSDVHLKFSNLILLNWAFTSLISIELNGIMGHHFSLVESALESFREKPINSVELDSSMYKSFFDVLTKNIEQFPESCVMLKPDLILKLSESCNCVRKSGAHTSRRGDSELTDDGDLVSINSYEH